MHIFDITEPSVPRPIGSYATQGNATGVTLAGKRAYLLDSAVGVTVLDVSDPRAPRLNGVYENDALPIDAQVAGNYLYLLDSESVQLIDTRTLTVTSRFRELRFPSELKLTDTVLYIADLYQLRIFRVHPDGYSLAVEETVPSDWVSDVVKSTPVNRLSQNFPNPFNPETWIPYQLASNVNVMLYIYDAQGRRIYAKTLGYRKAGSHTAHWDGRNAAGETCLRVVVYFLFHSSWRFPRDAKKMLIRR